MAKLGAFLVNTCNSLGYRMTTEESLVAPSVEIRPVSIQPFLCPPNYVSRKLVLTNTAYLLVQMAGCHHLTKIGSQLPLKVCTPVNTVVVE